MPGVITGDISNLPDIQAKERKEKEHSGGESQGTRGACSASAGSEDRYH